MATPDSTRTTTDFQTLAGEQDEQLADRSLAEIEAELTRLTCTCDATENEEEADELCDRMVELDWVIAEREARSLDDMAVKLRRLVASQIDGPGEWDGLNWRTVVRAAPRLARSLAAEGKASPADWQAEVDRSLRQMTEAEQDVWIELGERLIRARASAERAIDA